MKRIYAQAVAVIVYLGPYGNTKDSTSNERYHGSLQLLLQLMSKTSQRDPERETKLMEAWKSILGHAWFKRIWVVQEVAYAQSVVVMDHTTELGGSQFHVLLCESTAFDRRPTLLRNRTTRATPLTTAMSLRGFKPHKSLAELLHTHRERQATVALDKVYALLGLCTDNINSSELHVDYAVNSHVLYYKVALHILRMSGTLEFLTYRMLEQIDDARALTLRVALRGCECTWFPKWDRTTKVTTSAASPACVRYASKQHRPVPGAGKVRLGLSRRECFALGVTGFLIGRITSTFPSDGSVEAVPAKKPSLKLGRQWKAEELQGLWNWGEISNMLQAVFSRIGQRLCVDDEIWILRGTTGPAFLRKLRGGTELFYGDGLGNPRDGRLYSLICLEHSMFPQFGWFRGVEGDIVPEDHIAQLEAAAAAAGASSLTKIAARLVRYDPEYVILG